MPVRDDLDRLFVSLVHTVRERAPGDVHRPFEVLELVQDIVPYRALRRTRGFDANEDYEHAMTRLLSGERGYMRGDAKMQDTLREELATPHPDTALFREFARNHVAITEEGLAALAGLADDPATAPPPAVRTSAPTQPVVAEPTGRRMSAVSAAFAAFQTPTSTPAAAPPAPESTMAVTPMRFVTAGQLGGKCRYCNATLPDGRKLVFCPFCGHDLTMQQCPSCSTELELGWKFCVTCGRAATAPVTGEFPAQQGG
ncbi:MAG: zinc ribbon domain-containing protein [Gemmatimonadetes bacterium]|nr:zinc ribbon domain-containing protein [Gemmatimonadota bacterium]